MHLFGHYPAHDDFYLVVCNICNQVVKPQVFQSHCGKWMFSFLNYSAKLAMVLLRIITYDHDRGIADILFWLSCVLSTENTSDAFK